MTHVFYVDDVKKGICTVNSSSFNMKYIETILYGIMIVGKYEC